MMLHLVIKIKKIFKTSTIKVDVFNFCILSFNYLKLIMVVIKLMKTCTDVVCIALITMGVLYILENKKELKNTIMKPINNLMNSNSNN